MSSPWSVIRASSVLTRSITPFSSAMAKSASFPLKARNRFGTMPSSAPPTEPVRDSVAKVNDELAVGSDLEFQRRWWKFERAIWIFFTLLIVLDVLGVFGRGPLAKARLRAADGSAEVTYERIERHKTPSVLTAHFGPSAIQDGKVRLWVSDDLVKELGNQRVSP